MKNNMPEFAAFCQSLWHFAIGISPPCLRLLYSRGGVHPPPDFSALGLFGTGTFRHWDFSALGLFGTGTFRHWDFSALYSNSLHFQISNKSSILSGYLDSFLPPIFLLQSPSKF